MSDEQDQQTRVEFRGAQLQESGEQIEVVEVQEMTEEETA